MLANQGGEIRWSAKGQPHVKDHAKAKIKIIRKRLREVMQIDDDPFKPYRRVKAYKTKFRIIDKSFAHDPIDEHFPKED